MQGISSAVIQREKRFAESKAQATTVADKMIILACFKGIIRFNKSNKTYKQNLFKGSFTNEYFFSPDLFVLRRKYARLVHRAYFQKNRS